MTDTRARIRELQSAAQDHLDNSFGNAFNALFEAGIAAFLVAASDGELSRFAVEAGAGSNKNLGKKVSEAPSVEVAVIQAIRAIELELHSEFSVAEEVC